jgi:hypothetical protein
MYKKESSGREKGKAKQNKCQKVIPGGQEKLIISFQ